MCLDSAGLYIPFDPVVKDGVRRETEECAECRGGCREPMIGMRGLGLHVQLSSRQGERGAGQLEGEGRDLCRRPSINPHRERQTGNQSEYRL